MPEHKESEQFSTVGNLTLRAYQKALESDFTPLGPALDDRNKALSDEKYQHRFREDSNYLLSPNFLDKTLLQARLEAIEKARPDLKDSFPRGSTLIIAVLPAKETGRDLSAREIKSGQYLHHLVVLDENSCASTLCLWPGPFHQIVPASPRSQVSLPINYLNEDLPDVEDEDFKRIYNFHIDAFNFWRAFFGLEPVTDVPKLKD